MTYGPPFMSLSDVHRSLSREIRDAIALEIAATPKCYSYIVKEIRAAGDVYQVQVDFEESVSKGLDESLEGAAAAWKTPERGYGDVLCVVPEREEVTLRFVKPRPPIVGEKLVIFPPLYLERLREWWNDDTNIADALDWFSKVRELNSFDPCAVVAPDGRVPLRNAQKQAFALTGWTFGVLEGPPGTGKTYTLGAALASYLQAFPTHKVLLLSTTNTAVDLALVAVDEALETVSAGLIVRERCKRFGQHFSASYYKDRRHLLPSAEPELVQKLAEIESRRPDPSQVLDYARWKRELEAVRARFRSSTSDVLRYSRLSAMTACAAVYWMDILQSQQQFDLVVFDEASQVPLPYVMALGALGRRTLVTGDPAQLAPVVQSRHEQAQRWMSKTPFDIETKQLATTVGSRVFLDEQSRMVDHICTVVSEVFYKRRLILARDCRNNIAWQAEREIKRGSPIGAGVTVQPCSSRSVYSQKYRGPIRFETAQLISQLVMKLFRAEGAPEILVLTPFRAQRTLIRAMLGAHRQKVVVSTVHKAQGSEKHTVIFDPVDGTNSFLAGSAAERLINVAISRAKARLVILLSEADERNQILKRIIHASSSSLPIERPAVDPRQPSTDDAQNIEKWVRNADFPASILGKTVRIGTDSGTVIKVTESSFSLRNRDGQVQMFSVRHVRSRFGI